VGIDPGTTTGIALLDLEGNVVSVFSRRNMSRSDISKSIQGFGTPIVVAGDTNPPSRTLEKINAAFSSRMIVPRESLGVAEKISFANSLCDEERLFSNKHERDALASARFAFNRIKPLIGRINKVMSGGFQPDTAMDRSVKTEVILNRRNIRNTIEKYKNINGKAQL
jgi:predicted RNase H-like nuclease (RuvC/YqgF family)